MALSFLPIHDISKNIKSKHCYELAVLIINSFINKKQANIHPKKKIEKNIHILPDLLKYSREKKQYFFASGF